MNQPILYRKRFIPNEIICLKDDEMIFYDNKLMITKWNTLKPRKDIARGISCYFIEQGFKVSKVYNANNEIVYWYCDIIETDIDDEKQTIIFSDLLIDVIVYENGNVKVVDVGEIADALDEQLIEQNTASKALRTLDNLLHIIYSGQFHNLQAPILKIENS